MFYLGLFFYYERILKWEIFEEQSNIIGRRRRVLDRARETREMGFWEQAINEIWVNPKPWRLRGPSYKELPKEGRYVD